MANTKPLRIPVSSRSSAAIKKAREGKGWSQSELALKAGVPRARIKRLECNELKTILSSEYAPICRKLGLLFQKSAPSPQKRAKKIMDGELKKKKTPTKKVKKHPAKKKSMTLPKARRLVLESLEDKGVLDLTLRDLLSRTKAPRLVSIVIDT